MEWEAVIGLEVHVQLLTQSKMFSGASTAYGAEPNTQTCPIDLGFPGVLPVINKEAVRLAVLFGFAIQATVNRTSVFARKNYFYPDLPKGYQISQHEYPIVERGFIMIRDELNKSKRINITRAHLEEDTGKSLHDSFQGQTGLDFNRAGIPLLEIVSAPDMNFAIEAVAYLKQLYHIVCALDICSGNLQEGAFRCDANISIRPKGSNELNTRTEVKNINSFKFVEKAIELEIARHIQVVESGGTIIQETRLFDSAKNETRSMRVKENLNDYRYFPDPDLLPLELDVSFLDSIQSTLPELPQAKYERFKEQYNLSDYDAELLAFDRDKADYFENVVKLKVDAKLAANWILGELAAALNKENLLIKQTPVSEVTLAKILQLITNQTISGTIAKTVFEAVWNGEGDVDEIIQKKGLVQLNDTAAIAQLIEEAFRDHPAELASYRAGKVKLFGFFVGEVMKRSKGKANPKTINELLKQKLGS